MIETSNINITLIGVSNESNPKFSSDILEIISKAKFFSGGNRHYGLVKSILPIDFDWIPIKGKMESVINQYKSLETNQIVIFTSGDPFFFGFGNTLKRLMPDVQIKSYPFFHSIQRLAQKMSLNYSELKTISLHGRTWDKLDEALLNNLPLIGLLTDKTHSPKLIAERLIAFSYLNYEIIVGEELDGDSEKYSKLDLKQALNYQAADLNCVILKQTISKPLVRSFLDSSYVKLEGRPNMITKQYIRMISIESFSFNTSKVFWDIGACTGSISIEAKRNYPWLKVLSFEKRSECLDIINKNCKSHQVPGIEVFIGDFFNQKLDELPKPQSIFIGGHGGRLKELIELVDNYLESGGRIVMNTVQESSNSTFKSTVLEHNYSLLSSNQISINNHNTISVLVAQKM